MIEKLCTDCELHQNCIETNCMDGHGSDRPTWLFVAQHPGKEEDLHGIPQIGDSGQFFRDVLFNTAGFDKKRVRLTNAIRCWTGPGDPKPSESQIRACRRHVEDEISRCSPKVVVLMGAVALKSVTKRAGVSKLRGTCWESGGTHFVVTLHPAAVYRDLGSHKLEDFLSDLLLAKRIGTEGKIDRPARSWKMVSSYEEASDVLIEMSPMPDVAYDIETTTSSPHDPHAELAMVGFSWREHQAVSIPLYMKRSPIPRHLVHKLILRLKKVFRERKEQNLGFVTFSGSSDLAYPDVAHGIHEVLIASDPYFSHHLLREDFRSPSLKQLAWFFTEYGGYEEEFFDYLSANPEADYRRGGSLFHADPEKLAEYNCGDACVTKLIDMKLMQRLEDEGLLEIYEKISIPTLYTLAHMQKAGVKLDRKFLKKLGGQYLYRLAKLERSIRRLPDVVDFEKRVRKLGATEYKFNPRSPMELRDLLFDHVKLAPVSATPTGLPSTSAEVLEILSPQHPLPSLILEHRWITKFYGTYVKRWRESMRPNGIWHPRFDPTGTVTGRMASDMQQLPRVGTNADIRKLIVSRFRGGSVVEADYSQIELRIFAIVSGDPEMTRIFVEGRDAHCMAASMVYGYDADSVDWTNQKYADDRQRMKGAVSFGVIYGRGADAVAVDFGWSVPEAEEFIEKYFEIFDGIRQKIQYYKDFAMEMGYVENMFGRKRRLGEVYSNDFATRERALRQAVNHPIQGTAHDLLLLSMNTIRGELEQREFRSVILGEQHDSIMLDFHPDELEEGLDIVQWAMEEQVPDWVSVPLVAEIEIGRSLGELERIRR